jgi:hypothetical protein
MRVPEFGVLDCHPKITYHDIGVCPTGPFFGSVMAAMTMWVIEFGMPDSRLKTSSHDSGVCPPDPFSGQFSYRDDAGD